MDRARAEQVVTLATRDGFANAAIYGYYESGHANNYYVAAYNRQGHIYRWYTLAEYEAESR